MLLLEVLRTCFMYILIKIHWIKINNLLQPVQSNRKIALPDWDWILVFLVTWPNILSSLADFQCVCRCVSGICRILLDFKCLFKVQIMSGDQHSNFSFHLYLNPTAVRWCLRCPCFQHYSCVWSLLVLACDRFLCKYTGKYCSWL